MSSNTDELYLQARHRALRHRARVNTTDTFKNATLLRHLWDRCDEPKPVEPGDGAAGSDRLHDHAQDMRAGGQRQRRAWISSPLLPRPRVGQRNRLLGDAVHFDAEAAVADR